MRVLRVREVSDDSMGPSFAQLACLTSAAGAKLADGAGRDVRPEARAGSEKRPKTPT